MTKPPSQPPHLSTVAESPSNSGLTQARGKPIVASEPFAVADASSIMAYEGPVSEPEYSSHSSSTSSSGSLSAQERNKEVASTSNKDDCKHAGILYRSVKRYPRLYQFMLRWPRTFSLLLGVLLPQFFLVAVAVVVGIWLSLVEAPYEVTANNQIVSANVFAVEELLSIANRSFFMPAFCLELFAREQRNLSYISTYVNDTLIPSASSATIPLSPTKALNLTTLNLTGLHSYFVKCGQFARPLVNRLHEKEISKDSTGSLTFNWIRCIPGAKGLRKVAGMANIDMVPEMRYESQQRYFMESWLQNQQHLYWLYYRDLREANVSKDNATLIAARSSILNATGGNGCELNAAASGWFWFTVLSTVGYGNQSPDSPVGQAMVYSLGFLSILAFGGILSMAGYIASAVFDDALVRFQLRILTWPSISCVVWGSCYYVWMGLIAVVTQDYKINRVGETDFTMDEAYWFSYISSTTIGLGDIVLDPEVFLYRDLVTFPILFLVGFVLIAAFLSKLVELANHVYGKRSLVEEMLQQLKSTDMLNETATDMVTHAAGHMNDGAHKVVTGMRDFGSTVGDALFDAPAAVASHAVDQVNDGTHRMVADLKELSCRTYSMYVGHHNDGSESTFHHDF